MNKVSMAAASAFKLGDPFRQLSGSGYTEVVLDVDSRQLLLHDSPIAEYDLNLNELRITPAGWTTLTTKQRINAVLRAFNCGVSLYQVKGQWYIGKAGEQGQEVDRYDVVTIDPDSREVLSIEKGRL